VNNQGIVTLINPAAERLFEVSKADIIGFSVSKIPAFDYIISNNNWENTSYSQRIEYEDKRLVCNQAPIRVGDQVIGTVFILQDISELEQITSELRYAQD
jgi:sensor histidine kinase regulating citrate/malate metabolism